MTMNLINLPHDILILLREYICYAKTPEQFMYPSRVLGWESPYGEEFRAARDTEKVWRNFLSANTSLHELKRIASVLILSESYAITFLESEAFRTRVESLISDRNKQLYFHIRSRHLLENNLFDWNNSLGVSLINCSQNKDTFTFSNVSGIKLLQTSVRAIDHFHDVLHLTIKECQQLQIVSNLPSLQRLFINKCDSLTAVTNLPSLRQLWIYRCNALTTLSVPPLDVLEILHCHAFKLSSVLMNATKQHLSVEFENQELSASYLHELRHLQSIEIFNAKLSFEFHASALAQIPTISFTSCPQLVISHLRYLQVLYLWQCKAPVIDFESLPALRILKLNECKNLFQINFNEVDDNFVHLRQVELLRLSDLQKVVVERKIQRLVIQGKKRPEVIVPNPILVPCFTINACNFKSKM